MDPETKLRIGYWMNEKKCNRLGIFKLVEMLRDRGYSMVRIDQAQDWVTKGPFSVILHKLSDLLVKKNNGDENAAELLNAFEKYRLEHPWTIVIDPLEKVKNLIDRYTQYKLIEESELAIEDNVFTPPFVELRVTDKVTNLKALQDHGVHFPFVCKPLLAHGCSSAHQMSLIFCEDGLREIRPPCVAQSFIKHSAKLYKLFVIKEKYFVIERPSLKNFKAGNYPNIHYDSHDISKMNSTSELNELDEEDEKRKINRELKRQKLDRIVDVMRRKLGLSLFGIDVIIEDETGRHAIIDMNSFPGYDGVENILELLADLLIEEANLAFRNSHMNEVMTFDLPSTEKQADCIDGANKQITRVKRINGTRTNEKGENAGRCYCSNLNSSLVECDSGIDTSDS